MAKQPKTAPANSIHDQEPIGFVDGELKTYAPGETIPGPTILDEDGNEVDPESLVDDEDEDDED